METFLVLNGAELAASAPEQENMILGVASGTMEREAFTQWVRAHVIQRDQLDSV